MVWEAEPVGGELLGLHLTQGMTPLPLISANPFLFCIAEAHLFSAALSLSSLPVFCWDQNSFLSSSCCIFFYQTHFSRLPLNFWHWCLWLCCWMWVVSATAPCEMNITVMELTKVQPAWPDVRHQHVSFLVSCLSKPWSPGDEHFKSNKSNECKIKCI